MKCCDRDTDGDGNCPIHSAPGVLRDRYRPNAQPLRISDSPPVAGAIVDMAGNVVHPADCSEEQKRAILSSLAEALGPDKPMLPWRNYVSVYKPDQPADEPIIVEVDQTDLGASDDRPLGPDHPAYRRGS